MKELKTINVDAVAKGIEADAGVLLPGVRESLTEAKAGRVAALHAPAVVEARRLGSSCGGPDTIGWPHRPGRRTSD